MRSTAPVRLSHLINIGSKTERWLNEIGIYTKQQLQEIGPVEAWKRIKRVHPERATDTLLYMLQGALSEEVREELIVQACSPTPA